MTEVGFFWLLLPVAAASGWYIARRGIEKASGQRVTDLSNTYFRGLNYLLNEQPDKAIEVFLTLAEVDRNTVETHLALGSLFRRRGEVDRAIRFHQNLIERPTLSRTQRTQALLELGEDYMRAGLLDRAEALFSDLVEMNEHEPPALKHLTSIYQQEKDWELAIANAQQLEKIADRDLSRDIAQFYCERAAVEIEDKNLKAARSHLRSALIKDPSCVRASMMLGRIAQEEGDVEKAIQHYERIADQDPAYISEILPRLLDCHERSGIAGRAEAYLQSLIEDHEGISPVLALAEIIRNRDGVRPAADFISGQLRQRPSVRGLDALIGLNLTNSKGEARDNLLILQDLTQKLLDGSFVYRCNNCGFGLRSHHWQCPSCKNWNTVKPIQGVAGE